MYNRNRYTAPLLEWILAQRAVGLPGSTADGEIRVRVSLVLQGVVSHPREALSQGFAPQTPLVSTAFPKSDTMGRRKFLLNFLIFLVYIGLLWWHSYVFCHRFLLLRPRSTALHFLHFSIGFLRTLIMGRRKWISCSLGVLLFCWVVFRGLCVVAAVFVVWFVCGFQLSRGLFSGFCVLHWCRPSNGFVCRSSKVLPPD